MKINIYSIIILFIISFSHPVFAYKKPTKRQLCYSNQEKLELAISRYNLDKSSPIDNFYPGKDFEELEEHLIKEKYLKEGLILPTNECSYGGFRLASINDYEFRNMTEKISITSKSPIIFCKEHGAKETGYDRSKPLIIPEYDHSKETPLSKKYFQIQEERINEKKGEKMWANIKVLFHPYVLLSALLVFILSGGLKIAYIDDGKKGFSFKWKTFFTNKEFDDYVNKIKEEVKNKKE